MTSLLQNNKFCAVLIIFINVIFTLGLIWLTKSLATKIPIKAFGIMYAVQLIGNIILRIVMKENSTTLAKYYLIIILSMFILIVPLALLF